jgi:hypothetical protein
MSRTAAEVLDQDFLSARAHLLEVAALLDRLDRADGSATIVDDPRYRALFNAMAIAAAGSGHGGQRTQRMLEAMSDPSTQPLARAPSEPVCGVAMTVDPRT